MDEDEDEDFDDDFPPYSIEKSLQAFIDAKKILEHEPTVKDFHNIYLYFLDNLITDGLTDELYACLTNEGKNIEGSEEYIEIIKNFESKKNILDGYFEKFTKNALGNNITDIRKSMLFYYYPQFYNDLPLLKDNGYIIETDTGYEWLKSKQSLAEYFGNQKEHNNWKIIENLFNKDTLKNSFSSNGNAYGKNKPSKDYGELHTILKNTPKS